MVMSELVTISAVKLNKKETFAISKMMNFLLLLMIIPVLSSIERKVFILNQTQLIVLENVLFGNAARIQSDKVCQIIDNW